MQECLAQSDVVISAVPNAAFKVKTEWLKEGCVTVNVAADKNFEKDIRDKVCLVYLVLYIGVSHGGIGLHLHTRCGKSDDPDAPSESVRFFHSLLYQIHQ